jgi:hypothetical protein
MALKLLALLLVAGGGFALVLIFLITRLDTVDQGGVLLYVVPGSGRRSLVDAKVVTVLASAGSALIALGLVGLMIGRVLSRRPARIDGTVLSARQARRRRHPGLTFAIGAVILIGVAVFRWYGYVSNDVSVSNAVGIWLNSHMPTALRHWGCTRLKATFGNTTPPPKGCQSADNLALWSS